MKITATLLALCLSTPVAAATITFPPYFQTYHILGPSTFTGGFFPSATSITLSPTPRELLPGDGDWEYWIELDDFRGGGAIIAGACFSPPLSPPCFRETTSPTLQPFHVGDFFRISLFGGLPLRLFDSAPTLSLDLQFPDGVTIAQTPLPAGWLLFASVLGLGGLWRKLCRTI